MFQRAIYYEQASYAAKKVSKLLMLLDNLETLETLFTKKLTKDDSIFKKLVLDEFPDISSILDFFKNAFNHSEAVKSGKIVPKKGVDEDYDQTVRERKELEADLDDYLRQQKKVFNSSKLKYFGTGKDQFQIEVPEEFCKKVSAEYTLSSNKKGFKRFVTEETKEFLARQTKLEELEAEALAEVNRKIFRKFSSNKKIWDKVIYLTSKTDALLSLYLYSSNLGDDEGSCFPKILNPSQGPILEFKQGRHPVVISANPDLAFIPNDFVLESKVAILTGYFFSYCESPSEFKSCLYFLIFRCQYGWKINFNETNRAADNPSPNWL